jgi:hypothetical protein
MIDSILSILTPAVLAIAPSHAPVEKPEYNWNTQRQETLSSEANVSGPRMMSASFRGTQSFVGTALTIDDFNSD